MKATIKFILFLCPFLFIVSCESTKVIMTGQQHPAVSVEQVRIYDTPPSDAQPIGFLMAKASGKSQRSINAALQKLKVKAASLGANGMVINNVNTSTAWININNCPWPVDETDVSGRAFYSMAGNGQLTEGNAITLTQQEKDADKKAVSDLIGSWESVSFKGKTIGKNIEKIEFEFLPDNQLVITTIQQGKTNATKGIYTARGDKLIVKDSDDPDSSITYSLTDDHLVLIFDFPEDGQVVLQRVQENSP
jgi:hypothetical protein